MRGSLALLSTLFVRAIAAPLPSADPTLQVTHDVDIRTTFSPLATPVEEPEYGNDENKGDNKRERTAVTRNHVWIGGDKEEGIDEDKKPEHKAKLNRANSKETKSNKYQVDHERLKKQNKPYNSKSVGHKTNEQKTRPHKANENHQYEEKKVSEYRPVEDDNEGFAEFVEAMDEAAT
ncbi:hypothetical protein G7Z17_g9977 [Cylindrodendrum hubeiense]|uniref:Uncharacterized protein n=1 Tax=Cylindrodendrum hubeiense TaxID=595255 RepID=A0A9P5H2Z4_9HYPO|nr:hypothetical protein G7Z17_g9977 [Cylindrodendrum hubeiense]